MLYIASYLGLGVPAVAAGFLIVRGPGLTDTALYYGGAVILLAGLALPGLLGPRPAPPPPAPHRERTAGLPSVPCERARR